MDILTTIGAVVATAGNIYNLTKDLKNDKTLRQVGSLMRKLALAEIQIAELLHKNHTLEQENLDLKEDKSNPLVWRKPFYWKDGNDTPFCPSCYEEFRKRYHLNMIKPTNDSTAYKCTHCNHTF